MPDNPQPIALSRIATPELVAAARVIAGFKLARPEFASAANVSGVRSKTLSFSWRHDSRTIFASNGDYGHLRPAGAWTGAERTAAAACRRALRSAKIPSGEIAAVDIQREMGQTAERLSDAEVRVGKPVLLRKIARARREVSGIPVWPSYAMVGLTAKGAVGSLEIHWPELPPSIVKEALLLKQLVRRGFKPPEVKGGTPESVAAGIVHSTAIGFFMDIAAVIRVVYAVDERGMGRKPVLYLDRHGEPVDLPRSIRLTEPREGSRPKPVTAG